MKNTNVKTIAVFFMLAAASVVFCQESDAVNQDAAEKEKVVLTVDDAVAYALENNKSLKSAAIDLEMKKRANMYSWNTFLPSLGVSATASRTTENSTYDTIRSTIISEARLGALEKGGSFPSSKYDLAVSEAGFSDEEKLHWAVIAPNISAQWNFNLAMIESIRAAKASYEAGEISWEQTAKEMEVNVKKMFYGLLLQEESLNIQRDKLNNAKARYEQASINYKNGLVPELSVLNSQVNYENLKPEVLSAEQSFKQQKDMFVFLLGLPFGTDIELKGTVDSKFVEVNADELVSKYLENNDEVRSLKKNIELLNISLNASRFSTFTPSLSVNYGFQPIVYAGGEWNSLGDATDNGSLSFTLVYSNLLDMLPFSANMQKMKDTKQQIAQAELGLEQLVQNTEIEIHTLVDNLYKCQANIEAMMRNVELARKAYNSTLRAYNNGTQELLEVRDSENSLNQARLGLMNEKFNYISALLDLESKLNLNLH